MGENYKSNEPIGVVKITLISNTGQNEYRSFGPTKKYTWNGHYAYGFCHSVGEYTDARSTNSNNTIYLAYLQADPTNFNKIKKALEYLRDLAKAEDDPFAN
jgi:hypothetical protein